MAHSELARELSALEGEPVTPNVIYNMLRGVTRITKQRKALISSLLKRPVELIWPEVDEVQEAELVEDAGPPSETPHRLLASVGPDVLVKFRDATLGNPAIPVSFPMVEMRYAGEVPASAEWGDPLASETFVEMEAKFDAPKRYCTRVRGMSCYPALKNGDMTVWQPNVAPPTGQIVLAQNSEHQCTVKELGWDEKNDRHVLIPINNEEKAPPDGDGWTVIAQLVGVIRVDKGVEKTWYLKGGLTAEQLES